MTQHVFVTMTHDYADEFDVECCFVTTRAEITATLDTIAKAFLDGTLGTSKEFYFGTNEYLCFDDYDEFIQGVCITDCSPEFFAEFKQMQGKHGVGFCIMDSIVGYFDELEYQSEHLEFSDLIKIPLTDLELEQVAARVIKVINETLGSPAESITIMTTFEELGIDSLDMIETIMAIEDEFEMEFDDDSIEIKTVQEAVDFVTWELQK